MNTPPVNVNLDRSCYCERLGIGADPHHVATCPGKPVDIPLPLDAFRSITMTVRLGECDYPCDACRFGHLDGCPARPIEVSCSISGKTWAESEVMEIDDSILKSDYEDATTWGDATRQRIQALWALIKALVTGERMIVTEVGLLPSADQVRLVRERDSVFAALCEMAWAESTIIQGFANIDKVFTNRNRRAFHGCATEELAAYVTRLIEQVGALS